MSEDKKIAREMVSRPFVLVFHRYEFLWKRAPWIVAKIIHISLERTALMITIGQRGALTKHNAREMAAAWREAVRRYPKAQLCISMLGYNEDPREIWQIEDAARYVRW